MSSSRGNFTKVRCVRSSIFNHSSSETAALDVCNYFEEFESLLRNVDAIRGKTIFENATLENNFYADALDISQEEVQELKAVTSVKHLSCPGEIEPIDYQLHESDCDFHMKYEMSQSSPPDKHSLMSVKKRMEVKGDIYPYYNMKYGNYTWIGAEEFPNKNNNLNPFDFSNIVFCVKVYHPYLSYTGFNHRVKLLQEIHILGNQFLSDLKDKIVCSMDYAGISDESDNPFLKEDATELEKRDDYLSSFIFIENKFYNDTRSTSMRDLSSVIIDWAKGKNLGSFTKESMENKMMKDLKLKIGYPYVYQHQGDCEHVLVISDVRFLTIDDPLNTCNYPRVYAKGRCSGRYCMMCGISYASHACYSKPVGVKISISEVGKINVFSVFVPLKSFFNTFICYFMQKQQLWLVTGNSRLTHDKNYFCNRCFISYNYIDGKKIGNFKAYKYIDPIALL